MKVLLVRSPDHRLQRSTLWMPLGLAYLASAIRDRHQVEILDAPHLGLDANDVIRHVRTTRPDVVGFSSLTMSIYSSEMTARGIKEFDPGIVTLLGGPHLTGDPIHTLNICKAIDFGFAGEADRGLALFLDNASPADIPGLVWRDGNDSGTVRANPPEFIPDLDRLPRPAWELLDMPSYPSHSFFHMGRQPNALLSLTRGCPGRCDFCGVRTLQGTGYRKRSHDGIMEEVAELRERYGVRTLLFADDNLTADRDWAMALFERLAAMPDRFDWIPVHGIRLDTLDKDLVRAMERSGCVLFYAGIESGSQRILDLMNKGTTIKDIEERVRMIRRVSKMRVCGYFVLGYPTETRAEARQTIRFATRLGLDRVFFLPNLVCPGSDQHARILAASGGQSYTLDDLRHPIETGYRLVLDDRAGKDALSWEELKRLFLKAYVFFYLHPRTLRRVPSQVSMSGLRAAVRWVDGFFR